jgi:hypothetical protein
VPPRDRSSCPEEQEKARRKRKRKRRNTRRGHGGNGLGFVQEGKEERSCRIAGRQGKRRRRRYRERGKGAEQRPLGRRRSRSRSRPKGIQASIQEGKDRGSRKRIGDRKLATAVRAAERVADKRSAAAEGRPSLNCSWTGWPTPRAIRDDSTRLAGGYEWRRKSSWRIGRRRRSAAVGGEGVGVDRSGFAAAAVVPAGSLGYTEEPVSRSWKGVDNADEERRPPVVELSTRDAVGKVEASPAVRGPKAQLSASQLVSWLLD